MNEKTQRQIIQETHDAVLELKTSMVGIPGTSNGGLVKHVDDVEERVNDLGSSHGKLKRNFWLLIGILIGSGVLGGGIYGILHTG